MKTLILGSGMMARAVAYDLVRQRDVPEVIVCDREPGQLQALCRWLKSPKLRIVRADVTDRRAVRRLMERCDVAVSCVPYFYNLSLTRLAIATRTHFCDLGGNNGIVRRQLELDCRARRANVTVVPDCGLAPGMTNILVADGVSRLDSTEVVRIRVGGLPQKPRPPFNYRLVFSAHGLINEYSEPCLVIRNWRQSWVEPLTDVEAIDFPEPFGRLEAFNTSGGSSTLPETLRGRVRSLDYKTVRYPGHCAQFRLLRELGLMDSEPVTINRRRVVPREVLIYLLERMLGFEQDDVVLLRVEVRGKGQGRVRTIRYEVIDYAERRTGLTAMMRTTGFSAAIVALMLGRGQANGPGVLPNERAIPPGLFIKELPKRGIRLKISA
ncbi:MAG: saccharopine dehydrogenase C-terminal domain-containing protein [candidate division WOR-3 bacterium]